MEPQTYFEIDPTIVAAARRTEGELNHIFQQIDDVKTDNFYKVLFAMQKNNLSDRHFDWTTGYGYNDAGREVVEAIYADVFKAESALVRTQIVNGTHALTLGLNAILRPGDQMLSISGTPYDTLRETIGIGVKNGASLREIGVLYDAVELLDDGKIDIAAALTKLTDKTKLIYIQRSSGYSFRPASTIADIETAIKEIRRVAPDVLVMVDNCYGEFIERREPIEVGFLAPNVVAGAVKSAVFAAKLYESFGYNVTPKWDAARSDIIQAIELGDPQRVIAFCQAIQSVAPVDGFVAPLPWDMPGYDSQVIMAAGAFVQGSSIELSADAPMREPYAVYLQGGLTYEHGKLGAIYALQAIQNAENISGC